MKTYCQFLKESALYLGNRLQALLTAFFAVYSAPVDIGLTRRERRRRLWRYDSPPLQTLGTGRVFPPALGTIAF